VKSHAGGHLQHFGDNVGNLQHFGDNVGAPICSFLSFEHNATQAESANTKEGK
jgi:hypothetical protein